jgi:hypothetical protein
MSLGYQPAAGTHAIDVCTVAIRFAAVASSDAFERIKTLASAIALENDLPATEQVGLPPQLINAMGLPGSPMPLGVIYRRFAPNGQADVELRCEPSAVILQVRKYEGWSKLSDLLDKTILQLVPEYLSVLPAITGVQIQYDDRFLGGPAKEASPAAELFRQDTSWVTIHDRETRQQWHSHFGIFIREHDQGRELINVNVNVNDQLQASETDRVVSLVFLVAEMFDVPGESPLIVSQEDGVTVVRDLLGRARRRQKQLIEQVLSDAYLRAIHFKEAKD